MPKKVKNPVWPLGGSPWNKKLIRSLDTAFTQVTSGQLNVVTKTSAYTATSEDDVVLGNGTFTVTLPPAASCKYRVYYIKNIGAGTITVDGHGTETIDGSETNALSSQYDVIEIISDGSNWHIL